MPNSTSSLEINGAIGNDPLAPLFRGRPAGQSEAEPCLLLQLPSGAAVNPLAIAVQHPGLLAAVSARPEPVAALQGSSCLLFDLPAAAAATSFTLESLLSGGAPLSIEDAFAILKQLASALDALDAAGVVHLCVRPATILISEPLQVALFDQSIAYQSLPPETLAPIAFALPPEYLNGVRVTSSAHVFALARIGYRLLFGQEPFAQATPVEELFGLAHALWNEEPVGIAVKPVFERAFSREPSARFVHCEAFVSEFQTAWRAAASAPTRVSESAFGSVQPIASLAPAYRSQLPAVFASPRVTWLSWTAALLLAILSSGLAEASHDLGQKIAASRTQLEAAQTAEWGSAGKDNLGLIDGHLSVCNEASLPAEIDRIATVSWGSGRRLQAFASPEGAEWTARPGGMLPLSLSGPGGRIVWDGATAFYAMEVEFAGHRYLTGGLWSTPPGQCLVITHGS